jgi:LPXTG-site transpeptidase (sortase) family protein
MSNSLLRRLGLALGAGLFALLVWWGPLAGGDGIHARAKPSAAPPEATPTHTVPTLPAAAPSRVRIPALKIDTRVVPVSLGASRTLRPPRSATLVGWWSGGAKPGAPRGTVLIAGHTVHTGGGVLDELPRLREGALIQVRTASGLMTYRTTSVVRYGKGELAKHAEQVFSQRVPSRIAVITCDDWDGREYRANVVAYGEPVAAKPVTKG